MLRVAVLLAVLAAVLPGGASASQLIDRNASDVKLQVNRSGQALLTYRADGQLKHVLVWGAVDARVPNRSVAQVKFQVDYSGGWGSFHELVWKRFANACKPYTGPQLALLVTACTAPDGSYWAVQSWQRGLPDLGFTPWTPNQGAWELRVSHFTGALAQLEVHSDWVYGGRFQELFGRMTYKGAPVHGFKTTSTGVPLDTYGRNLYLDTFDSVYGQGWKRENGFVVHNPDGDFCYGFYPFRVSAYDHPRTIADAATRGPGVGSQYRITVIGPGVSPDVTWAGPGLHPFDPGNPQDVQLEQQMNAVLDQLAAGDRGCKEH
jgi:hypothetical protein